MERERFRRFGLYFAFFIGVITIVLALFYVYITHQNRETIEQIGNEYASMVSEQVTGHFETIVDLRFDDIEASAADLALDMSEENLNKNLNRLISNGFQQVAFFTSSDDFIFLTGGTFEPYYVSSFLDLVPNGELDISSGNTETGEVVILLTAPCYLNYEGRDVIALVGTLPVSYFQRRLQLDDHPDRNYSLIVRSDGSFVIRDVVEYEGRDYTSMYALLAQTDLEAAEELEQAIKNREDFSAIVDLNQIAHIYASPLPNSYWYLVSIVPYGRIDHLISEQQLTLFLGGLIAAVVFIVGALALYQVLKRMVRDQDVMLESEMKRNESLANKDRMLEDLNQNLVVPLRGISDLSRQALEQTAARRQNMLHDIHDISDYLLSRLQQITNPVSLDDLSTFEITSVEQVVSRCLDQFGPIMRLKSQHLIVDVGPMKKEKLYCDPRKIERVLHALLTCASESSANGKDIRLIITQDQSNVAPNFVQLRIDCLLDSKVDSIQDIQDLYPLVQAVEKASGQLDTQIDPVRFSVTLDVEAAKNQPEYPSLQGRVLLVTGDDQSGLIKQLLESLGLQVTLSEHVEPILDKISDFDICLMDERLEEMESEELLFALIDEGIPFETLSPSKIGRNPQGHIFKPLFYSSIYPSLQRMLDHEEGIY